MSDYFSGPAKDGDSSNQLLAKIWYWVYRNWQATTGGGSSGGGGVQRTLTSSAATASGSLAAGAKSIAIVTSSDFSGTINGAAFPAFASFNVSVDAPANTLPAVAYTRSAGTLYITTLT